MNDSVSHVISVRAIEDIIQIQKLIQDCPNFKSIQMGKNKIQEKTVFSAFEHGEYTPDLENNSFHSVVKECDFENSFKCKDKTCHRLDMGTWNPDSDFTKFVNPDMIVLENYGIIESNPSDNDIKCWSSDSDITVLRVKKEFRNELSNKVEWEERRNLGDDNSLSKTTLDWESHSLINLAGVESKENNIPDILTPFTIWSKTESEKEDSSMIFVESKCSFSPFKERTPEVGFSVDREEKRFEKETKERKIQSKLGSLQKFIKSTFGCFTKKISSSNDG